jgi:hypothetical protein
MTPEGRQISKVRSSWVDPGMRRSNYGRGDYYDDHMERTGQSQDRPDDPGWVSGLWKGGAAVAGILPGGKAIVGGVKKAWDTIMDMDYDAINERKRQRYNEWYESSGTRAKDENRAEHQADKYDKIKAYEYDKTDRQLGDDYADAVEQGYTGAQLGRLT